MSQPAQPSKDLIVRGGHVVDGTGAPGFRGDVRARGGRIAEVGPDLVPDGETEIDAGGAVVAPGFIDTHAHTDPQVFWDPGLDPDPLHGVTTMLVGNCSLSLYPVTDASRAGIADLFSYIEDVPRHLFDDNVPWTWHDFAGYRDTVNAVGTGINLAALVGHSPLRLTVMGDDAWTRAATADENARHGRPAGRGHAGRCLGAVVVLPRRRPARPPGALAGRRQRRVRRALRRAGPVRPRRRRTRPRTPRRQPGRAPRRPRAALRAPCGIPLTWTGFLYSDTNPASTQRWIDLARELRAEGIGFYPQLSLRTVDFRINWDSSMMFMSMPQGWHKVIAASGEAKAGLLRDPAWRAAARRGVGPYREGDVPAPEAGDRAVRRGGRQGERAVASAVPSRSWSPSAAATRPTCSRTSSPPTTAVRGSWRWASRTPTWTVSRGRSPTRRCW
ncbi:amidohydrolase family protein [Yinghuangia aomiensis]